VIVTVALTLTGCAQPPAHHPPPTTASDRDATAADITRLENEIKTFPHVTNATLDHVKGTFVYGRSTYGTVLSEATDRATLIDTLDGVCRALWLALGAGLGDLSIMIENPATGTVLNATALGFRSPTAHYADLQQRYGPAPTPGNTNP
jgi:hypothetical protein